MTSKSVPGLPDRYTLISLDRIDSTNAETVRRARSSDPSVSGNSVVWAHEQTGGRGRRGRAWASPPGNLYCSIIVRPEGPLAQAAQTGYVAALAIHDLMVSCCKESAQVQTKWPNDVLINDKKASGILLESSATPDGVVDWLVIGIGINVAHYPEDTPYATTSLNNERSQPISVKDTLVRLITAFDRWYHVWVKQGFEAIRSPWIRNARGIGEQIIVRLEKQELSGIFAGIDHDGALILRQETGDQLITVGDLFFPAHSEQRTPHAASN